ncbi:MAG: uroporphyrinogen-III synthase [Candidatus Acidiferrales bacterium]
MMSETAAVKGRRGRGFDGLRVLSLESRRGPEMARLIETYGGEAVVAPSMREVPLESNVQAVEFVGKLAGKQFDMVIFLTGVGTRALARVADSVCPREEFVAALRGVSVVARGPKPIAVLREMGVAMTLAAPEPNTWRELLGALDEQRETLPLAGRSVAVQEYGRSNPELLAGLAERGAVVTTVPVYQWALPEDLEPLRMAVRRIAAGEIDVALFTTSIQVAHLLQVAAEMKLEDEVRRAFARIVVASIGPMTSEELRAEGFAADIEATHPKMGFLVKEAAEQSAVWARKRQRDAH